MRRQIQSQDDTIRDIKQSLAQVSRLTRLKHIFIQSFIDSAILTSLKHRKFIAKLIAERISYPFAKKIFQASIDGKWTAESFHANCDNKGPTVTFIRTTDDRIFGGYTEVSWDLPKTFEAGFYKEDAHAFLFNCEPYWQVYPVVERKKAIFCDSNIMIQFGYSDIVILNSPQLHSVSYSYPSTAYPTIGITKKPKFIDNMNSFSSDNLGSAQNDVSGLVTSFTVTGEPKFTVEELEVYQILQDN